MRIPYSEPGTTKKNMNNSSPKVPDIDKEKCIGCMQCVENCPDACIKLNPGRKAEANLDHCKGCGICETLCPVKAINMKDRLIK